MKKLLWDIFIGIYLVSQIAQKYWQYLWVGERKEAAERYGWHSQEFDEDYRSRLEWADENFEGLMQKFYRDVVQEMVDRGWCKWEEKATA